MLTRSWMASRNGKLRRSNIDPEYIEAMRAAFHRVCDALQLNSHADDPMTEIVVTKLHLPDSSEQRGGQDGRLDAAERGAQVLGIRRRLQVGELMGVADGGRRARDGRRAGSSDRPHGRGTPRPRPGRRRLDEFRRYRCPSQIARKRQQPRPRRLIRPTGRLTRDNGGKDWTTSRWSAHSSAVIRRP
jgi:hypothetical protein